MFLVCFLSSVSVAKGMDATAPPPPSPPQQELVPRSVVQDGHEFYVYISIAVFGVHDQYQDVRYRLWDMFCRLVWKMPLDGIASAKFRTPPLNLEDTEARACLDASIAHLGLARLAALDYAAVSERIRDHVILQTTQPLSAPLYVVCPLVSRTYRLGMVLYDARTDASRPNEEWHPTRTWDPPDDTFKPVRYVHLLQRRDTLQMLVDRKTTGAENIRLLVPTRVVATLSSDLKTHPLFEAASSDEIVKRAIYTLAVFDETKRVHLPVGPFIAPGSLIQDTDMNTLHYIRLDMSVVSKKSNYRFLIESCQKTSVPIHIYACSAQSGTVTRRSATLIGHWRVDYTSPRIDVRDTDDAILIVPGAASREAADACVRCEWKCQVVSRK